MHPCIYAFGYLGIYVMYLGWVKVSKRYTPKILPSIAIKGWNDNEQRQKSHRLRRILCNFQFESCIKGGVGWQIGGFFEVYLVFKRGIWRKFDSQCH